MTSFVTPDGRADVIRRALRNRQLLRVLAAFLIFNIAWWANWIAVLVWAYEWDSVRGASAFALVQLVPSAILATPAASALGRLPRTTALTLGYLVQAVAQLTLGVSLLAGAPVLVVGLASMLVAVSVTLTRPVHNTLLPEISETTGDLTVGNAASGTLEATAIFVGPLLCGLLIGGWGSHGVVLLMAAATGVAVLATARLSATNGEASPAVSFAHDGRSRVRLVLRDPAARVLSAMVAAESTLIGMIDILVVVLALDLLQLAESGPGILNAAIGLGGLAGASLTFVLVGRQRLATALLLGALAAGVPFALAGFAPSVAAAFGLLALCGAGKAFFEVTARTLLQRLLPDRLLTAVFGLQESLMMAGFAAGSLAAPLLVATAGSRGAFLVAGLFLPLVTIASWSLVRRLDAQTAVPSDVLELLLRIPIFSVLAPRIVERMACEAEPVAAAKTAVLITEGEPGDRFYVIADGVVEVTRGATRLRCLRAGQWFGELALLRDVPRTASVKALTDVELWALDRDSFLAAVAYCPASMEAADEHASGRYR